MVVQAERTLSQSQPTEYFSREVASHDERRYLQ